MVQGGDGLGGNANELENESSEGGAGSRGGRDSPGFEVTLGDFYAKGASVDTRPLPSSISDSAASKVHNVSPFSVVTQFFTVFHVYPPSFLGLFLDFCANVPRTAPIKVT